MTGWGDPAIDPETRILRNRVGARTQAELDAREAGFALIRLYELAFADLVGDYDFDHLCAFHRHLFQDVYDWAGEPRTVDIGHQGWFAHAAHIETSAHKIFHELAEENLLAGLPRQQFVERLAYYLGEINALHPFREGNGRTQRAFLSQLARRNGWRIRWELLDAQENIRASERSFFGDNSLLEAIIDALLEAL